MKEEKEKQDLSLDDVLDLEYQEKKDKKKTVEVNAYEDYKSFAISRYQASVLKESGKIKNIEKAIRTYNNKNALSFNLMLNAVKTCDKLKIKEVNKA